MMIRMMMDIHCKRKELIDIYSLVDNMVKALSKIKNISMRCDDEITCYI
jgi:hypothetical protein